MVAAILCYVIFRTVSRPVWELCRAAARISGGDLDTRLPIPERGVLRELGEHLSRMAEELKKLDWQHPADKESSAYRLLSEASRDKRLSTQDWIALFEQYREGVKQQ